MEVKTVIEKFLYCPISSSCEIMDIFARLPGAVHHRGDAKLEQFVYVPGTRKDRVVLVAHADTVWHAHYGNPQQAKIAFHEGVYYSENPLCGSGADDRAGCAMVWALQDSGHSLLILDGEEKGKRGAKYLKKAYPKLYRQLNRHRYMIELDWQGTEGCLYNQVDNSPAFKRYIEKETGFLDSHAKGGCDLQVLCQKVCGVNMATGWHHCHRQTETLDVAQWENSYTILKTFLGKKQPRFASPLRYRFRNCVMRVRALCGRILRKLKLK